MSQLLRGGCSCGRNECFITIPLAASDQAEVYFDSSSLNRRTQAAPLTAWLRVPLEWYQSSTVSYFPDETHAAIRRTFVPPEDPHCRRVFCGFCGTPLTHWTESPPEEADYMSITVGSLFSQDQSALEDLGLLPEDADTGAPVISTSTSTSVTPAPSSSRQVASTEPQMFVTRQRGTLGGIPWFEEMIEGSRLGRVGKHRRGVGGNESMHVEWEVTEWHDTTPSIGAETHGAATASPRISTKRKSPQVG
ncbi:uncharacterized protein GIQ15_03963 [Arthroderma uncinatum]|uniref:uncharacterized protein n=1 Tax=Arthroderma uncinatum TaxID=74035 RepID=UPI00144ACBB2|nr:uncharacterized protein GIQ15_03963 [Arthroderma uncinatum]KAF3481204.1 hypothetical protein GIQ15_03963 [Arthroderma uncinatum]